MSAKTFNYLILRASPDPVRFESLNAGVVVFDGQNTVVKLDENRKKYSILHPDLGRIDYSNWAVEIESKLRDVPEDMQVNLLNFISHPFKPDFNIGQTIGLSAEEQAAAIFERMISKQRATIERINSNKKRQTKLYKELRDWFKRYKIFSKDVDKLSDHLIVSSYPIDVSSDLYADFALKNGKLNIIETLDLRSIDRLTPSIRGEAALKGITLNSANNAKKIAIVQASDYQIAKPAINVISKYADDVYDLSYSADKNRLSIYIADTLNKPDLLSIS